MQDLALYRSFREKEVASAARSLISLCRELAPGMLEKRDRGRGADLALQPLAYGSHKAMEHIPGADLVEPELAHGDQEVAGGESADGDESEEGDESVDGDDLANVQAQKALPVHEHVAVCLKLCW